MDKLASALLNIARVTNFPIDGNTALITNPVIEILKDLLAAIYAEDEPLKILAQELVNVGSSKELASESLYRLATLASQIEQKITDWTSFEIHLEQLNLLLDILLMINQATQPESIFHPNLTLINVQLFHYIQELYLEPLPSQPPTVLVGRVAAGRNSVAVRTFTDNSLLKRIRLEYGEKLPFPRLSASGLLAKRTGSRLENLDQWSQRDSVGYDVELYARGRDRLIGSIQTRSNQDLRVEFLSGKNLKLSFPNPAEPEMLITSIMDEDRDVLLRVFHFKFSQSNHAEQD